MSCIISTAGRRLTHEKYSIDILLLIDYTSFMQKRQLLQKLAIAFFFGRFESLQVILGISAVIHGAMLYALHDEIIPIAVPLASGSILFGAGMFTLLSLLKYDLKMLKKANFLEFLSWNYLAICSAISTSFFYSVAYITLAAVSGILFINVGVRRYE